MGDDPHQYSSVLRGIATMSRRWSPAPSGRYSSVLRGIATGCIRSRRRSPPAVLIGPTRDRNMFVSDTAEFSVACTHRSYEGSQLDCGRGFGLSHLVLIGPTRDRNSGTAYGLDTGREVLIGPTRDRNPVGRRRSGRGSRGGTHRSYEGSQQRPQRGHRIEADLRYSSVLRGIATRRPAPRWRRPSGTHRSYEGSQLVSVRWR